MMRAASPNAPDSAARVGPADRAAFVIGVALSGFFDGILLHQVLQWHHLFSLVPGDAWRDIRNQILADGLFHVLMYAVAAAGLVMLYRARADLVRQGSGRRVAGAAIMGFGAWNIVDVGVFHWVLGIHRIRVNVPDPMLYDIAWFVSLGLVPLAAGWLLRRGARGSDGSGGSGGRMAGGAAAALVIAAAPIANLPVPGSHTVAVFRPGVPAAAVFTAVAAIDGRVVLMDSEARFAVIATSAPGAAGALHRAGALVVSRSPAVAGCAAVARFI